jgi:chorismate synthase
LCLLWEKFFIDKPYQDLDFSLAETMLRSLSRLGINRKMENYIKKKLKTRRYRWRNNNLRNPKCSIGLGEPVFDKLHAELGKAMPSINAVHGFEYEVGGFFGARMKNSKHNDLYNEMEVPNQFIWRIQGGISNGMDMYFELLSSQSRL